jgi:hypothetical protein
MPMMAMFLLVLPVAASSPCDDAAQARVEVAQGLIDSLEKTSARDRAAVLERARILLERTIEQAPGCESARTLLDQAEAIVEEVAAVSSSAALEEILADATRYVEAYEKEGVKDPTDLEALRFQIAGLKDRLPGDERVDALAARAAALQDKR